MFVTISVTQVQQKQVKEVFISSQVQPFHPVHGGREGMTRQQLGRQGLVTWQWTRKDRMGPDPVVKQLRSKANLQKHSQLPKGEVQLRTKHSTPEH